MTAFVTVSVASSFVVPSEEAREALVRVLSDPLNVETAPTEETQAERVETEVETAPAAETEKKTTTTKKRTTKKGAK